MKLFDQIKKDRITAIKEKNDVAKNLLGCVIGDSSKMDKEPSDEFVISIIKKFMKGVEDSRKITFEDYEKKVFDTEEDALEYGEKIAIFSNKTESEIGILESYLPKQLDEQEISGIIRKIYIPDQHTKLGDIMKFFKDNYKGRYDGALVSKIAKEML